MQLGLNLLAIWLQEGREGELLAQVLNVLIGGKTRSISGNLEQDTARLAEIDRLEVVAVDDIGHLQACLGNPLPPLRMLCIILFAEHHVMYAAPAHSSRLKFRSRFNL